MGGAERSERERKRSQTQAARAASGGHTGGNANRNAIVVGVVIVVVLAVAVIGGVLLQNHHNDTVAEASIPTKPVPAATYPVSLDASSATVLVGKDTAKITLDTYEDFICPVCGQFEKVYGDQIEKQLEAGTIKVRYHLVNLLDNHSNPAGYSMTAANAALSVAAAAPGKFIDFHSSLYAAQPEENGRGYDETQLIALANKLGVTGDAFSNSVKNKTYDTQIAKSLADAEKNPALAQDDGQGDKGFGTPTIVANGKLQNIGDAQWLTKLVGNAKAG